MFDSEDPSLFDIRSRGVGPAGTLPITAEMLLNRPSGDLFGLTQAAGMGWDPRKLGGPEVLLLSTHGGIRAADGPFESGVRLGRLTVHRKIRLDFPSNQVRDTKGLRVKTRVKAGLSNHNETQVRDTKGL